MHRTRVPAIDVSLIGTKRGHFKLETVLEYNDHTEMRADRVRSEKKGLHIFRTRVGRDVVILWCQTAHHVTHATTCEVRNVSTVTQNLRDLARGLLHWRRVHTLTVAALLRKSVCLPDSASGPPACRIRQASCPAAETAWQAILPE